MKQKITNAEAVQAADTLRRFCNQFTPQTSCYGCPFYWEKAPVIRNSCGLYYRYPVNYDLRVAKKKMEAAKK